MTTVDPFIDFFPLPPFVVPAELDLKKLIYIRDSAESSCFVGSRLTLARVTRGFNCQEVYINRFPLDDCDVTWM